MQVPCKKSLLVAQQSPVSFRLELFQPVDLGFDLAKLSAADRQRAATGTFF